MFAFYSSIAIPFVVQIAAVSEKNGTTVISISHLEVDMEVNPPFLATVYQMFSKQKHSDGLIYYYCNPVLRIRDPTFLTPGSGMAKKIT
jgi:hypothetical protein